jgi:hypothetical protein
MPMLNTIFAQSTTSDDAADTIASVIVWGSILIGTVVSLQLLFRSFFPLRLKESSPWNFAKPYGAYVLGTFTGFVENASKASTTRTTGATGTISSVTDHMSTVRIKTHTTTTVSNEFTLTDAEGGSMAVSLKNFDAHIGTGHQVSVGWITWKQWNGAYLFVRNHTTGQTYQSTSRGRGSPLWGLQFADKRGWRGMLQKTSWVLGILGLLLCLPIHIVARLILRARRRAFASTGLRPLEQALDQKAAQMRALMTARTPARSTALAPPTHPSNLPTPTPSTSEELTRLFQLHQQGALTAEEYESAKQRILQNGG